MAGVFILTLCVCGVFAQGYYGPDRLQFGGLLEGEKKVVRSALAFQSHYLNRDQETLKLVPSLNYTDMNDVHHVINTMCNKMNDGIYALVGTTRIFTQDTVTSFSRRYKMPFVSTGMAVSGRSQESGYVLYMRPLYAHALYDVIAYKGWDKIHYIYSDLDGLHRMEQLRDVIVEHGMRIGTSMRRVVGGAEAAQALSDMYRADPNSYYHIVLDLPATHMMDIITLAEKKDWLTRFHYLMAGLDIDDVELPSLYPRGGVNVTGLRLVDPDSHEVSAYSSHWKSADKMDFPKAGTDHIPYEAALAVDTVSLLQKAMLRQRHLQAGVFRGEGSRSTNYCFQNDSFPLGYAVKTAMQDVDFVGLTGRVAFDKFGLRRNYRLDVMEISRQARYGKVGRWEDGELDMSVTPVVPTVDEADLQQPKHADRPLIITSILSAPFLMIKDDENAKGNDRFEGFSVDLANIISKLENFTYEMRLVKDEKYGAREDDGKWNGMVGELIRHEADLSIAPLTITHERSEVIDFSKPFMGLGISIMMKKPKVVTPDVLSFMQPFSYELWTCIFFAMYGVSVGMFLVGRFSSSEYDVEGEQDEQSYSNIFSIGNSLWFSLGSFLGQGGDVLPRSIPGRILASVWWFFILIAISSYTANLAAFLTASRMQVPIESASDLAKQTKIKYGSVESGSTTTFFKTSSIPVYEKMWSFMKASGPSVFVGGNQEGIQKVRDSDWNYAFLAESTTIEYNNQQKPCNTMKIGSNLDDKGYGIGTPIGSYLRRSFNWRVLELQETGKLRELETMWWYEKGQCGGGPNAKKPVVTNALQWPGVRGVFYILFGGLGLGAFCSACELIYESKRDANKKQTTWMDAILTKTQLSAAGFPEPEKEASQLHEEAGKGEMCGEACAEYGAYDEYGEKSEYTQV